MRIDKVIADASEHGQSLVIRFPDGKNGWKDGSETDIVLKVVSADGKQFHKVITKHAQAALGREDELSVSERQHQTAEQVASCIVGWTGLEDEKGPVPYSHEKATELMKTPELAFVREQVEAYVVKRANFFRKGKEPTRSVHSPVGAAEHGQLNGGKPATGAPKLTEAAQEARQVNLID